MPDNPIAPPTRIPLLRYSIVVMLFLASSINYADRSALAVAQSGIDKQFGIDPVFWSKIVAAWGFSYVLVQIPSGRLLDRFGSRRVYGISIFLWSLLILMHGFVHFAADGLLAFSLLVTLNYLVGLAEAPAFPGNARLVAAWFPAKERGTASAIFNSSQYFATVLFVPIMAWLAQYLSWSWVFWSMGIFGLIITAVWFKTVYAPREHPRLSHAELEHIKAGGALVDMTQSKAAKKGWFYFKQILTNRLLVGVYIGQYCITTLTYFFVQWVMPYLVNQRHMSILQAGFIAALPAVCGFIGGVLGGILSDLLLRKGFSLTFARKTPILIGMFAAASVVLCNYVNTDWLIIVILCVAFFGKGIGALGWTVVSDSSPKEVIGLCGGVFNMIGNSAQITLAFTVGYIVKGTGDFKLVLLFVAGHAVLAILAYGLIVPKIHRLELKEPGDGPGFPVI